MPRLEDDNEFEKIKRLLKDLPKVDAPSNFENELSRRINQGEQTKEKESWFDKVFSPKLVPSAALAVTAVIILFLLKGNVSDVEDPFQVMPKLREEQNLKQDQLGTGSDKIIAEETNNLSKREKSNGRTSNESESRNNFHDGDSNIIEISSFGNTSIERISVTASNYLPDQAIIVSGGLNYKVVRVGGEERKMIEMLRKKINPTPKYQRNN
ncbi:MAG TPA: hypothetical protein VIH28_04830 [Ignavibacteriaceae bacterium]